MVWSAVAPFFNTALIVTGGVLVVYNQNRQNTSRLDSDTIQRLKEAIEARDLQINNLHSQVQHLQSQVSALEAANSSLKDLAIGKDLLLDIKTSISLFTPLLGEQGILSQFTRHDMVMEKELREIKAMLKGTT